MNIYSFHEWLRDFKNYHKYLYITLMCYVIMLTAAIGSTLMVVGPVLLAVFVEPWLAFIATITFPLGILLVAFVFDWFDM